METLPWPMRCTVMDLSYLNRLNSALLDEEDVEEFEKPTTAKAQIISQKVIERLLKRLSTHPNVKTAITSRWMHSKAAVGRTSHKILSTVPGRNWARQVYFHRYAQRSYSIPFLDAQLCHVSISIGLQCGVPRREYVEAVYLHSLLNHRVWSEEWPQLKWRHPFSTISHLVAVHTGRRSSSR